MRGKVPTLLLKYHHPGITPAHAGKSGLGYGAGGGGWDHPRPCGEKASTTRNAISNIGSPPPMRGKAIRRKRVNHSIGITPAHAGKSYCDLHFCAHCQDHPRPCGEKFLQAVCPSATWGSPPPMRGKAVRHAVRGAGGRITPAHAGKSLDRPYRKRGEQDHPRPCGEKLNPRRNSGTAAGSPPPMRGKVN